MKEQRKAVKTEKLKSPAPVKDSAKSAPSKLKLLIVIVDAVKSEYYSDLLQNFEINMKLIFSGRGTAQTEMLSLLGLTGSEKSVIIGTVREDRAKDALSTLEEKFRTIKNGKGVACTVPLTSTIGVTIFRFLSNIRDS